MNLKLQIILIVIFVALLLVIIGFVRKRKIALKYGLPWMVAIALLLVLSIFPQIISLISTVMSVISPVNVLIFFAFIFLACVILTLLMAISKLSNNVKDLAQKIALLENNKEK